MEEKNDTISKERVEEEPETAKEETEDKEKVGKPKRGISKRKKRLLIVIVVIAAALIIGLWGAVPSDYLTVSDITNHSEAYLDKTIEIKGSVEDWNSSAKKFNLSDGVTKINVTYTTLPEGFNNGKDVVVKGVLENDNGLVIKSQEIKVGCPSKY